MKLKADVEAGKHPEMIISKDGALRYRSKLNDEELMKEIMTEARHTPLFSPFGRYQGISRFE